MTGGSPGLRFASSGLRSRAQRATPPSWPRRLVGTTRQALPWGTPPLPTRGRGSASTACAAYLTFDPAYSIKQIEIEGITPAMTQISRAWGYLLLLASFGLIAGVLVSG